MRPRVLVAAMDLFCFYKGTLLPERYASCNLYFRKTTSYFVQRVSFSMFKLFRSDFEAILLSVRERLLVQVILKKRAHFLRVILSIIDPVISANQRRETRDERRKSTIAPAYP